MVKKSAMILAGLVGIMSSSLVMADTKVTTETLVECTGDITNRTQYYSETSGAVDTSVTKNAGIKILRTTFMENGTPTSSFLYGEIAFGYTFVLPSLIESPAGADKSQHEFLSPPDPKLNFRFATSSNGNRIRGTLDSRSIGFGSDSHGVDAYKADDLTCKIDF